MRWSSRDSRQLVAGVCNAPKAGFAIQLSPSSQRSEEARPPPASAMTVRQPEVTDCNLTVPIATLAANRHSQEPLFHPNCIQIFARQVNTSASVNHGRSYRSLRNRVGHSSGQFAYNVHGGEVKFFLSAMRERSFSGANHRIPSTACCGPGARSQEPPEYEELLISVAVLDVEAEKRSISPCLPRAEVLVSVTEDIR